MSADPRLLDQPHRRLNALTGGWVSVSPHRTQRPWQGRVEVTARAALPHYDAQCYLCPGNVRANGERNPGYESTYIFTNDFAAFLPEVVGVEETAQPLLLARAQRGTCRVLCFSPRHDLSLADLSIGEVRAVVDLWASEVRELGARWRWVQVFENRGELMGCSNPHPHGQVWATESLPNEPAKELARQREMDGSA